MTVPASGDYARRQPPRVPKANSKPEPMQIEYLRNNPWQPRLEINPAELAPLVESIRRYGFFGHIEARRDPGDPQGPLQIVFGHRRVKAAQLAGLMTIPIQIVERTDEQMREIAFLENHTQKQLTYWEEAIFFDRLRREFGYSVRDLAKALGLSKGYVQHRVDVLRLPQGSPLRDLAERNEIDMTTALVLEPLAATMPEDEFNELLDDARSKTMTAEQIRRLAQAKAAGAAIDIERDDKGRRIWRTPAPPPSPSDIGQDLEVALTEPASETPFVPRSGATDIVFRPGSSEEAATRDFAREAAPLGEPPAEAPSVVWDSRRFDLEDPVRRRAAKFADQIEQSVPFTVQYGEGVAWDHLTQDEKDLVRAMDGQFRGRMRGLIPGYDG
jgi:ParB/RepB/Spo0J family partition protein